MFTFRRLGFFILMGLVTSLSACAMGRTNLVDSGAVDVQVENTPNIKIQGVMVLADQEESIIYGRVRRLGVYNNSFFGGQVTAKAVFPDGSIDKKADTLLRRAPRARGFRAIYPVANFKIVFPEQLPRGTVLVLSFGNRSRSDG